MSKNFKDWQIKKEKIQNTTNKVFFREWQIYFTSIWVNVWFEQDWKWKLFNRPVLIVKKFNQNIFYWIPLSTQEKEWKFYFEFEFEKWKKSYALLSQMKLFDSKRLKLKIWWINKDLLFRIKNKLKKLLD